MDLLDVSVQSPAQLENADQNNSASSQTQDSQENQV